VLNLHQGMFVELKIFFHPNLKFSVFSPPHGSPKPAARRKNKPAPVPPASGASPKDPPPPPSGSTPEKPEKPEKPPRPAVGPVSSTLPRPNKKHSGEYDVRAAGSCTVENVSTITMEKRQKFNDSSNSSGIRKHSTDGLEHQQNFMISSMHQTVSSGGGENICTESEKCGEGNESLPPTEQSQTLPSTATLGATTVTIMSGCSGKTESLQQKNVGHSSTGGCNAERKLPQRPVPVAAPRSTVNINASSVTVNNKEVQSHSFENRTSESTCSASSRTSTELTKDVETTGGHDSAILRKPLQSDSGERSNKPAVPERPAALLRPHSSFRGSRHSADSDTSSGDKPNTDVSIGFCS